MFWATILPFIIALNNSTYLVFAMWEIKTDDSASLTAVAAASHKQLEYN
jgi:L-rhamnose mutarotase